MCRVFGRREEYRSKDEASYWFSRKPELDALYEMSIRAAEEQTDGANRSLQIEAFQKRAGEMSSLPLIWKLNAALTGNVKFWIDLLEGLPTSVREQARMDAGQFEELNRKAIGLAELFREILGNPFRQVSVDPACRSWNDGKVTKLAREIYDLRCFEDLPRLGDFLELAGCTDSEILSHCRSPRQHVRGCWVLEQLIVTPNT